MKTNNRILVIGDLHLPYTKDSALEFCQSVFNQNKCNQAVFIGDLVDLHAVSYHEKHPESDGPGVEIEKARDALQRWYRAFPVARVCLGNHDRLLVRKAASNSVPEFVLKSYQDIWGTKGWRYDLQHVIDNVLYVHGDNCGGGLWPAYNTMKKLAMSVVMGHYHTACGVKYLCNPTSRLFGLDTGCLIDRKAIQFDYAAANPCKPILACCTVIDGNPQVWPMPLSKGEKYA